MIALGPSVVGRIVWPRAAKRSDSLVVVVGPSSRYGGGTSEGRRLPKVVSTGGESSLRRRLVTVSERHVDRKWRLPIRILMKNVQNGAKWRLRQPYHVRKEDGCDQGSCGDVPDPVA